MPPAQDTVRRNRAGGLLASIQTPSIVIRREIEIFAPPDVVWEWISRVDLWADWHPEISSSWWVTQPGLGARFKWRRNLLGVDAAVVSWYESGEFAWEGRSWLTEIRQTFRIRGDYRSTLLSTEFMASGSIVRILRLLLVGRIATWNEIWLGVLKTRLESAHERSSPTRRSQRRDRQRRASRAALRRADRDRFRIM